MNAVDSYEDAVKIAGDRIESDGRTIFRQPSKRLSTLVRGVWYLRNHNGLMARVGVRTGRVWGADGAPKTSVV